MFYLPLSFPQFLLFSFLNFYSHFSLLLLLLLPLLNFIVFSPPPPPHFYCFPSFSSSSFLLFFPPPPPPPPPPHSIVFPPPPPPPSSSNLYFLHTNLVPSSIYNEVDSRFLKEHNRLASTCPWSNLSQVYGTSIKRKIGIRGAITQQCEKRFPISYLALKLTY